MTDPQHFGITLWNAKPGRGEDFVARWSALVQWTVEAFPGQGPGRLSADPDDPTRFSSVFAWTDRSLVEDWKAQPEFQRMWAEMEETLTSSDRRTYDLRVRIDVVS